MMTAFMGFRRTVSNASTFHKPESSLLYAARLAGVVPWSMNADGVMHWGAFSSLVLGYSAQELAAHNSLPFPLIPEEDHPVARRALLSARMGFPADCECQLLHKAGHRIWTRWFMVNEGGGIHGVVQDVSTQHALREQLIWAKKQETAAILASGLTHNFKNLLTAILGYCEILETEPGFKDRQQKGLAIIKGAATRGKGLIEQLMGVVQNVESGKTLVNLNSVVQEVGDLLRHSMGANGELEFDLAADLPRVSITPGRIHQVIMNLVINARDALGHNGRVVLRTRVTGLASEATRPFERPPGKYLFLAVEDNGCGIPKEQIVRIFEPYYSTKGKQGSGLGLFTANQIMAEHGGFIDCYSQPGVGTRFRVYLPLNEDHPVE